MNATKVAILPRVIGLSFIITILVLAFLRHAAMASPGDVDPGFGFAGKYVSSLQSPSETLALAIQINGKLVAVGNVQNPRSFLISRHNADGSLDTSFGDGGNVMTNFAAGASSANAVAIQPDGKILAAGYAGDLLALARYNSNGSLDSTFGSGGLVAARFEPARSETVSLASSVAIQSDGKILVAGDSFVLNPLAPDYALDCNFALARYNSDGSPDESFGIAGIVIGDFGSFDRSRALAIQSDGKIVVAGDSNSTGTGPYTLVLGRYNSDGSADETFGGSGNALPVANSFQVSALALQANEKLLVAGTYRNGSQSSADFALARYNEDGTLDDTFGAGGLSITDFVWSNSNSRDNGAFALSLQPDGKILIGGYSGYAFALARFTSDGILDETFGNSGIAITQVNALGESAINFAIAGSTSSASFSSVFFSDCCSAPPDGVGLDLLRVEQAFALTVHADGKIVAGGVVDDHATLVRFHGRSTPKLTVANAGATIPHGDFITVTPPKGFTSFIYVGNVPQMGIGGIVSIDGAISCGTRCSASYDSGSAVILNAVWPAGSYFVGWDGCAADSGGGCVVTMDHDAAVTANFEPDLPFLADTSILPNGEVALAYGAPSGMIWGAPADPRRVGFREIA